MRARRVRIQLVGRLLPSGQVNTVKVIRGEDPWLPGSEIWDLDGRLHREDGPAIIRTDGHEAWFLNGQLHREDGPARTYVDRAEEWWYNGQMIPNPTIYFHWLRSLKRLLRFTVLGIGRILR